MTTSVPVEQVPQHIAIVMDGNGRWAVNRGKKRSFGHKAGVDTVRNIVESAIRLGIQELTLFAFSSENWKRPKDEVSVLMSLFIAALEREVAKLHKNDVAIRFIGDISAFSEKLRKGITAAQEKTAGNQRLILNIAANYGGRWEITQACKKIAESAVDGQIDPSCIDETLFSNYLCLHADNSPDLFIRTGGERRISNFLLWHLAYSELYFTDVLWPDFDEAQLIAAINDYASRERRFGQTSSQIQSQQEKT